MLLLLTYPLSPVADAAGRTASAIVNTILNGKGAPKSSLGVNGDFYIDTRSLLIYGPKKSGKWPSPRSLQGPTGPSGSDGKNGSDGKSSTSNVSAINGAQGAVGPAGVQGERGEKGEKGESGLPGIAGSMGAPGLPGAPGANGATGATGAQGPAGANGSPGDKGETGTAGPSEVTVIDIPAFTLGTSVPFSYAISTPIGGFNANNSYTFEIFLRGTSGLVDLVLGADLISSGNLLKFNFQRSDFRYSTYSSIQNSYGFYFSGAILIGDTNSDLVIRILDGRGETGGGALTLSGKAYITLVGAIR